MKVLFNRQSMLTAFAPVSGVAPTRSPKQILVNVLLDATADGSTLLATDLDIGIRHRVLGIKVDTPGRAILPTQRFGQILRSCGDDELSLSIEGDSLHIRGERSSFKLPSEDPDLFPEVPDFEATAYHAIESVDLRRAIRRTVFATDIESTRYALGGCLFEFAGGTLSLVGTDGRRLAKQSVPVLTDGEPETPENPVIPTKVLRLLERSLDESDPPVHMAFQGKTAVLFRTDRATFYSRLVEGRFPRYQDVFPKSFEVRVPLEAGPLLRAIGQASIVTSEESRGVDFTFGGGRLRLTSQAPDSGAADVEMPLEFDGPEVAITFDPRYVTEALKVLDEAAAIRAELIDHKSAAVFRVEDGYQYVVMPLIREVKATGEAP